VRPARRIGISLATGLAFLFGAIPVGLAAAEAEPDLAIVGLRVLDGDGWHAESDFRLDWDRPAGGAGQPVVAVDYLVRDAAGAVVVPPARVEEEDPTAVRIGVPALAGEYTAEVWLEGTKGAGPHSEATLRFDPERPAPARPLAPTGWVRAGLPVAIGIEHPAEPWPASGVRGYAISVSGDGGTEPCAGADRCTAEETDADGGPDDDTIPIGPLPEGTSFLRAYAVSGAGMRSIEGRTAELHADGTGPSVAFDPAPKSWERGPVEVTARARDELSGMAPDGSSDARTGVVVDGTVAALAPGPTARTVVGGEGIHTLLAFARDAVGNPSADAPPSRAGSAAAVVRIDETPPRVAFLPRPEPTEPERIEALVSDELAGPHPTRGSIAVRPIGSRGPFAPIPTRVEPGRLLAVWDSDSYPHGGYEFEAVAYDEAGNRAVTDRRVGGSPMVLFNPVKTTTALLTGFGGRRAVVQTCGRRGGGVRCRRRRVDAYDKRPAHRSTRYGQRIAVGGRLAARSGSPLAGQDVRIVETFDAGAQQERRESSAETAADGIFVLLLGAGPSRRIQVEFPGTPLLGRTHSRSLRLAVRAPLRLRSSAATAAVGGAPIVFSGAVGHAAATLPKEGLPVTLQFRIGAGAWTEFRTVQTDARGRFRYAYAFADDDSRGVRFQFRAVLSRQPGWPYAPGASLPVTVRGR
jgi:hypothetical protein